MADSEEADILLKRLNPTPVKTFRFKGRNSISGTLNMPVDIFELPESSSQQTILTKLQGNRLVFVLVTKLATRFHVIDEEAGSDEWNGQQYLDYLLTNFETKTVEHKYSLSMVKKGTNDPLSQPFSYEGVLQLISFDQGDDAPAGGYNLRIEFVVGNVIVVLNT